nr:reverse transcriptase domain-containing protein [Tanacetum cinerariifolium]
LYDDDYNEIEVPTTQPLPIVSTQGMHRQTSTPRKPTKKHIPKKGAEIKIDQVTEAQNVSYVVAKSAKEAEEKENLETVEKAILAEEVETIVFDVDEVEFSNSMITLGYFLGLIKLGLGLILDLEFLDLDNKLGPFEIVERIGPVAYRLRLPKELVGVHDTFYVSNLKKCLADVNLHVPLDEVKVDDKLRFVEEPIEILDCGVKKLKRRWIPIVKVR